jgi:hypothetical protein
MFVKLYNKEKQNKNKTKQNKQKTYLKLYITGGNKEEKDACILQSRMNRKQINQNT